MSFEEAKCFIDQIAEYVYLLQLYTWGEPLLNKDTLRIIQYAKKKNVYVMISTNGTALTPRYSRRLIEAGTDYVTVAIDGGSDDTYAQYRRGGNYTKVLDNIKYLLEERKRSNVTRPFVEWQFIVFRHNEHEVEATEQMAYGLGIDKFTPLPAYVEDEDWLPRGEKYRTQILNPERLKNCERPWSHLNVRADGGVASCCYEFFKKDDFGDLNASTFVDIWNNSLFQQSRRLISQRKKGLPLEEASIICRDCLESGIRPSYVEVSLEEPEKNTLENNTDGEIATHQEKEQVAAHP